MKVLASGALLVILAFGPWASAQVTNDSRHRFAQMVNGGGFRTILFATNTGSSPIAVTIDTYDRATRGATAMNMGFAVLGGAVTSDGSVTISPGGTARFTSDGAGSLTVGWGRINATAGTLVALAQFMLSDAGGRTLATVGIPSSPILLSFSLPVNRSQSRNTDTGFALAGATTSTARITMTLRNTAGEVFATLPLQLDSSDHLAKFFGELVPGLPAEFVGTAFFSSDRGLVVTAILSQEGTLAGLPFYVGTPGLAAQAEAFSPSEVGADPIHRERIHDTIQPWPRTSLLRQRGDRRVIRRAGTA
ncbi:MAG: hypothetical protein HY652_11310 [Acidobacteria bacterium]|nr:hypothetical protein [Acidobacteriota bacterium]